MSNSFLVFVFLLNTLLFSQTKVKVGADLLLSKFHHLIESKKLGLVVNQTSCLSNGVHLVDALIEYENENSEVLFPPGKDKTIKALFAPEHGIRGKFSAGEAVVDGKDKLTQIPIRSLYGKTKKPSQEMLKDINMLLFDIQDVGARFYTYISTLYYCMEAAIENNIPILVLDRPNPITGTYVDGPIIEEELLSFVGIAPLPIAHGMTVGEIALYFKDLLFRKMGRTADLEIINLENWQRDYFFDECSLNWIKPSPNITNLNTAIVYPGMCLLEGTNVSEGRGTHSPFLKFGAPFINSYELLVELKNSSICGMDYKTTEFTPRKIKGMSLYPKHENEKCYGLELIITDRELFEPVKFGVTLLNALYKLYPGKFKFNNNWIDKLFGSENLRKMILSGKSTSEIIYRWENELENFKKIRNQYLLY